MFKYNRLFAKVALEGMTKTEFRLKLGISTTTLAKLHEGKYVSMETLDRACAYFGCEIGDLIEYVPDDINAANQKSTRRKTRIVTINDSKEKRQAALAKKRATIHSEKAREV